MVDAGFDLDAVGNPAIGRLGDESRRDEVMEHTFIRWIGASRGSDGSLAGRCSGSSDPRHAG